MNPTDTSILATVDASPWGPLMTGGDQAVFWWILLTHVVASGLVASVAFNWQPARLRKPPWATWLLLFCFAFMFPVVGGLSLVALVRSSLRRQEQVMGLAKAESVALPEYDVQAKDVNRSGQGAIRSRLDTAVPGAIRMQSLLTLQSVPTRVANPILEDLLGDSTDDVRLVAFGMLDAEEKKISSHIQIERDNLRAAQAPQQQFNSFKHLAELHWELIYASLAQGELRKHTLATALDYVQRAEALGLPANSGLNFLKGRILLAQGDVPGAHEALQTALALGQPHASVLPYLAEIAYDRRDFATVRSMMAQLDKLHIASKTRAVADLWCGRDRLGLLSDRRFLPHV